jgi:beta-glucanase (GH16 family)
MKATTKVLFICLVGVMYSFKSNIPDTPQHWTDPPPGWKLVWEENFDIDDFINPDKWGYVPRGSADWNRHMSAYDSLYDVKDGKLILRGMVNPGLPGDTMPFLTGGVYTKNRVAFYHGRLEICVMFGDAQGAWPALWLLPFDNKARWPDGGELDIAERLHGEPQVHQNVHSYYIDRLKQRNPRTSVTTPIRNGEYNTYGVELHPDSVVFLVNGNRTLCYPRIDVPEEQLQFPFDKPFYLLMDMQLGGGWTGPPNPDHLPVEMYIDWVRFYEWK